MAAARSAESFVCVVRFATPKARNAFYATSGQAGQGAEAQARSMLAELGITDVELATWVQPRAKVANAANAAAGAGAAVKAEATTGSFSSPPQQQQHRSIGMRDGLAGGSVALAVCLRLHAEVLHGRSAQQWRQWQALLAPPGGGRS